MTPVTIRIFVIMSALNSAAYAAGSVLGVGAHASLGTEELMP